MMSDFHMLRMNVCDAGRHAGTQRHEKGLTFIRVRAWLQEGLGCPPHRPASEKLISTTTTATEYNSSCANELKIQARQIGYVLAGAGR